MFSCLHTGLCFALAFLSLAQTAPLPVSDAASAFEPTASSDDGSHPQPSAVECNPAGRSGIDNGLLLPANGTKVTKGEAFDVLYCSPTYHSTRSLGWDVVAFNSEHPEGGKILQSDVQGRQVSVTVDDDYYDRIGIYERQTGYGGDQFALLSRAILVE